jgi:2-dehydropantoate 2-reductase
MKIAVIGAGAIGGLVAGYLKFKEEDVLLIGRHSAVEAISHKGLHISGTRGNIHVKIDVHTALQQTPDVVILAVKTQDCERAIKDNLEFLKHTPIIATQNGVQAEHIIAQLVPRENIFSSIVMFGATYLEPGRYVHNFEGPWVIGKFFGKDDAKLNTFFKLLGKICPIVVSQDIVGMKYYKIFLNANNCIPAVLGMSMQEAFADTDISSISIALWKESFDLVTRAGISLAALPDFSVERLKKLINAPLPHASKIFSEMMVNLSQEPLYGSILQSLKRDRPSEIDYINGEFLNIAKQHKLKSPLNEKLVHMVHLVEKTKKFFTKPQLLSEIRKLL